MNNWYLNRFATMSAKEIPYRLLQFSQRKYEEYFVTGKRLPEVNIPLPDLLLESELNSKELFPPEIDIFGKIFNYSDSEIDWHRDIHSDVAFSRHFSKKISIRKNPELSAKNVWEINRLQFLPQISLNYKLTKDPDYIRLFLEIMNSWIDNNPYLRGINWYSNIEVNIRLINWFFCWELMDVSDLVERNPRVKHFVVTKWIPSIYQHCEFSSQNPSRYSSANNHLIAEYAGLFIAASYWKFDESDRWKKYAKQGLEKEIVLQHSNGINREEAAEYIQFITDFFLIAFVVAERTANPFSETYRRSLKQVFEYILRFLDINGNYPAYGDGDDGKVISLSYKGEPNNFISLLTSASIIFRDQKFKHRLSVYDLKNQILFGAKGERVFNSLTREDRVLNSAFYPHEGHHIFRKQEGGKEIYMHFDSAPLGYLSIAAHGHADALSFILNINGYGIIVDPGTYSYHVSKEWRDYFVSTMAHNTICIDGTSQAYHAGDTMWLDHYSCVLHSYGSDLPVEYVRAEHNGYKSANHIREVLFDKSSSSFTIIDEIVIAADAVCECMILFHLHPDIKVSRLSHNEFMLLHPDGIRVGISLGSFTGCKVIKGGQTPILGWYSASFGEKVPTNVICGEKKAGQSFKSVTKIDIYEY
jgi:hypothetical protein